VLRQHAYSDNPTSMYTNIQTNTTQTHVNDVIPAHNIDQDRLKNDADDLFNRVVTAVSENYSVRERIFQDITETKKRAIVLIKIQKGSITDMYGVCLPTYENIDAIAVLLGDTLIPYVGWSDYCYDVPNGLYKGWRIQAYSSPRPTLYDPFGDCLTICMFKTDLRSRLGL
jgi:hypothetical protein